MRLFFLYMKPSFWFTFIRRVIYLIIAMHWQGQITDICICCLGRQKEINRKKRGFQLMWWQLLMQIEYSEYVRNSWPWD